MNRLVTAATVLTIGAAAMSTTAPAFAASPAVPFYLAAPGSITCKQIDDARAQYAASSDLSVKTTDFVIVDQAIVGASVEIGLLDLGEIQAGHVAQHPDLWMHRTLDETMKVARIIRDACAGHPAMTMRALVSSSNTRAAGRSADPPHCAEDRIASSSANPRRVGNPESLTRRPSKVGTDGVGSPARA